MKLTKVLALALALCMVVLALASCKKTPVEPKVDLADPYAGKTHQEVSDALYAQVLGEFNEYYQAALKADSTSERFALMAIAEAKLLGQGVMLPSSSKGGN